MGDYQNNESFMDKDGNKINGRTITETDSYVCNHCGAPVDVTTIDFKTRRARCEFCGQEVIFPKRTSTASPSATHALNEAKDFFLQANFASAKTCAETVLTMMPKNVPALYIVAYYTAFAAPVKNRGTLNNLFNVVIQDSDFEVEEEETFKELIIATMLHSMEYEAQILDRFYAFDSAEEIAAFMEKYCPVAIAKRASSEWFTKELADLYLKISARVKIPKTLFALLKSIEKGDDSPLRNNNFYLKTKALNYYNNYVEPIGKILGAYCDAEWRAKFVNAFKKIEAKFKKNLGID